ncbi:MAG: TonB family protein [Fibrella sp.]|nr:TonB family protein [Armatimonadota bacterium]
MAEKTRPNHDSPVGDLALTFERNQSQRLMIASTISIAVNVMFLIGAARGMEEKPLSETWDRPVIRIITVDPKVTPTPDTVATPTPTPIAQIEPKNNPERKPEPRQIPPSSRPVDHTPVRRSEPTPRIVLQPTPPPPDVPETPEVEPVAPVIQPVEDPVDTATMEPRQAVQAATARVMETTASSRRTGAAVATSTVTTPAQRNSMTTEINTSIAGPLPADSTASLAGRKRTPRPSVAEGVAIGTPDIASGEFGASGVMNRQVTSAPDRRTGVENRASPSGVAALVSEPRNSNDIPTTSGVISGPTLRILSGPNMGARKTSLMQSDAGGPTGEAYDVRVRGIANSKGAPGSGMSRTSGIVATGVGSGGEGAPVKARGGTMNLSGGEGGSTQARGNLGGENRLSLNPASGVVAGSGANGVRDFGINSAADKGRDAEIKGTGHAEGAQRAAIPVVAGGGVADIVSSKTGVRDGYNKTFQATDGKDPKGTRSVSASTGNGLPEKIDNPHIDSIVSAKILAQKQPEITNELKATHPKKVTVEFTIKANGSTSYRIVSSSGNPDVDAAVLKACAGYRWQAGSKGGKPTASSQRITFDPNG